MYLLARPLLAEITLVLGAILLIIIGAFSSNNNAKLIARLSSLLLLVILSILAFFPNENGVSSNFFHYFANNDYISLAKLIIILSGSFVLSLYAGVSDKNKEFPVMMLFSLVGMLILVSANDFLSLYLGIELQSLCLYVLASYDHKNSKSTEAGIKYFILSSVSSGLVLYGISLIYGFGSTTNFSELAILIKSYHHLNLGLLVGFILVIVGLCFKISAAPFHMWSPDVYEGSPTIVTAFFVTAPKMAVMLLLTRLMINPFGGWLVKWQQIIIVISILSMIVGAFGAIGQNNIKRLLAYSSIGHVGYMMMGLATNTNDGIRAIITYAIIYIVINIGIFACIIITKTEDVNSYKGLAKNNPLLAFLMSVILFSMAGIPPFAGFFAKFYILFASIKSNMIWLSVIAIAASVISAYYYLRIVKIIYFDECREEIIATKYDNSLLLAMMSVLFIVTYMLFSDKITIIVARAADSLFL
jgi:NADH-quinone oxidoreductase subunit N